MAKLVCVVSRDSRNDPELERKIELLSRRLTPDNISPHPSVVINEDGLALAVLNPTGALRTHRSSVCLGFMTDPSTEWWRPGADVPDGTYVLFRSDESVVELINDSVGSRTIWYVMTATRFIASSSQRAIIALLGSFSPNPRVFPWMLSSGCLGPENSWDQRLQMIPPNSRLTLDRRRWRLNLDCRGTEFMPVKASPEEQRQELKRKVEHVFSHGDLDPSKWVVLLSGGVDSRAIISLLKNGRDFRCVTWGLKKALGIERSDAYIAGQLAERLGLNHTYFELDRSPEPAEALLNRFLVAGEGRVDAITGYMDGFELWRQLFEAGVAGVIRGDHGFGPRHPVYTSFGARQKCACLLLSDYENVPTTLANELPLQQLPESLARRRGESILGFRDRLFHAFKHPVSLAALTDLKCSYVEVMSPLLTRSIVTHVRRMPDRLRLGKRLSIEAGHKMVADIPYAEVAAIDTPPNVLSSRPIVELVTDELTSSAAAAAIPSKLLNFIVRNMRSARKVHPSTPASHPKYLLPSSIRHFVGPATAPVREITKTMLKKPKIDFNVLGFRACVISRMQTMLAGDAKGFRST
jgi:Asparagine synthase